MSPALHISIPETSVSGPPKSKPFTLYHVVLQLPLRRQELRKRYTDFTQLHTDLLAQTRSAPPAPLPPKGWFQRTVNNETLTEQRRAGLEQYLRAVMDSDDARWRSCLAWRAFLGLQSEADSDARQGQPSYLQTRPKTLDTSEWLELHRKMKVRVQEARQLIKQREMASTPQQQHHAAAEAKSTLIRAATTIEELDAGLGVRPGSEADNRYTASSLGAGEWRRRKNMITAAKNEVQALDNVLKTAPQTELVPEPALKTAEKQEKSLMAGRTKPGGRVLGPAQETHRTRELDNNGVLQLQQQIRQEQDEDVLVLGKTITKLKDMGILMNEELTIQNEMLKMVEEDVDRVQAKVDIGRKKIKTIR